MRLNLPSHSQKLGRFFPVFFSFIFCLNTQASAHTMVDETIAHLFTHLPDHSRIAEKCINCHTSQFNAVSASIHGQAGMLESYPKGTICLTCHEVNHIVTDPHKIENFRLELFETLPRDVACMRCHSNNIIAKEYGFPPHVPSEFEHSMHFRKSRLGDSKAPLCYDCHGAHNVSRVENPNSPVHDINQKVKVCSKCHEGANMNFAGTFDHKPTTPDHKMVEYTITIMFKILTLSTFIVLGFFMLLDITTIIRNGIFTKQKSHHEKANQKYVKRLNRPLRIQHFLMFGSVITLMITGWPLLEPDSQSAQTLSHILGGARSVAWIHRIAGLIMIGDFFYHLVYLYQRFRQGSRNFPMMPRPLDLIHVGQMLAFFFGIRKEKPHFDEFAFSNNSITSPSDV